MPQVGVQNLTSFVQMSAFPLQMDGIHSVHSRSFILSSRQSSVSVRSFRIVFLFDRAQTLQALFGRSEMLGVAAPVGVEPTA